MLCILNSNFLCDLCHLKAVLWLHLPPCGPFDTQDWRVCIKSGQRPAQHPKSTGRSFYTRECLGWKQMKGWPRKLARKHFLCWTLLGTEGKELSETDYVDRLFSLLKKPHFSLLKLISDWFEGDLQQLLTNELLVWQCALGNVDLSSSESQLKKSCLYYQ